ncbi:MAG: hypothetical protein Phog2KO_21290 [Phototrophicaceae bacterium]
MNTSLKDQSRYLQQLINKGENLEKELDDLASQSENTQLKMYHKWRTRVLATCTPLLQEIKQEDLVKEIKELPPNSASVATIIGMMYGMLLEISNGKLDYLVHTIQRESIENLLSQADGLMGSDEQEINSYNLAAMSASIVLERAIRKLCERNELIPEDGKWVSLGSLLNILKEKEKFPKHQLSQLDAWRNIRNDVSHGNFENYKREDIETMIEGIKRFVREHL